MLIDNKITTPQEILLNINHYKNSDKIKELKIFPDLKFNRYYWTQLTISWIIRKYILFKYNNII